MMMDQQQPPQPTTSTAQEEEEEEEEVGMIWIGDLQHWMDEEEEEEVRTLWIGDLQHWMDEAYINLCFAHTGEVFTSKVIHNKKTTTGKSSETCYGFILFKSHVIAERIFRRFNGTPMPLVAVGTNFSLNWAAKVVVTDGTTTTIWNEILTTGQGQCGCMFSSTIPPQIPSSTNKKTVFGASQQFSSLEMVNNSSWEHMLKWWSLSQLDDGTCTARTVHAADIVYKIGAFLNSSLIYTPTEVEFAEGVLDELQSHVNSINVAKELHSMGALEALLLNLSCQHAGVGAKVVKVVSAMLQNNPGSQQLVMEAGGEELLFHNLFCSVDATTMTNILSAISSLFRNNTPAITAFQQRDGYADLIYGLRTMSTICQRNTLNLIHCLVLEDKLGCNIVIGLEYPHFMMKLASSYCAEVREAALRCLLLLTQVEGGGNSGQLFKNDYLLKTLLLKLIETISAMASEDLGAEEIQLVDSLWNACYNEPSSLREKGLLGTCEDAPALGPPSAATPIFKSNSSSTSNGRSNPSVSKRANFLWTSDFL